MQNIYLKLSNKKLRKRFNKRHYKKPKKEKKLSLSPYLLNNRVQIIKKKHTTSAKIKKNIKQIKTKIKKSFLKIRKKKLKLKNKIKKRLITKLLRSKFRKMFIPPKKNKKVIPICFFQHI